MLHALTNKYYSAFSLNARQAMPASMVPAPAR